MTKRPTIRSLAEKAGVSTATVSLALRDHPRIRPQVRKRIKDLAEKEGYVPNPVVANLIAQMRTGNPGSAMSTLGMILMPPHHEDARHPAIRGWVDAVRERASRLGYGLDEFILDRELSPKRVAGILEARGIQGALLIGPFSHNRLPEELEILLENVAVVVLGQRPEFPPLSCVLNNQFASALSAVRELGRRGVTRPGLCLHPDLDDVTDHRFSGGFLVGRKEMPGCRGNGIFDYQPGGRTAFLRWLQKVKPDGILTLHPEIKVWLEEEGIRIPGDVALAHLDVLPSMKGWSGICQNGEQIGQSAVDMLIGQIHRNEIGVPPFQKCMFINGEWVEGATCKNRTLNI